VRQGLHERAASSLVVIAGGTPWSRYPGCSVIKDGVRLMQALPATPR
jgi:hypothetical protein